MLKIISKSIGIGIGIGIGEYPGIGIGIGGNFGIGAALQKTPSPLAWFEPGTSSI